MLVPTYVKSARLVSSELDVEPQEYLLQADKCTIGRSEECNIKINRKFVSRLHATVEREGSHFVLRHKGRNPTFVDRAPVAESCMLRHGAEIGLAAPEPVLLFLDNDATAEPPPRRLVYDARREDFRLDGRWLFVTGQERDLLLYLYKNAGQMCTLHDCRLAVWGFDDRSNYLHSVVTKLRNKMRLVDPGCDLIKNTHGQGFTLEI